MKEPDLPVHVGNLILHQLYLSGNSIQWFADQMGMQRANCYRIFRAPSMTIERLVRISQIMQHDFFADISNQLNF